MFLQFLILKYCNKKKIFAYVKNIVSVVSIVYFIFSHLPKKTILGGTVDLDTIKNDHENIKTQFYEIVDLHNIILKDNPPVDNLTNEMVLKEATKQRFYQTFLKQSKIVLNLVYQNKPDYLDLQTQFSDFLGDLTYLRGYRANMEFGKSGNIFLPDQKLLTNEYLFFSTLYVLLSMLSTLQTQIQSNPVGINILYKYFEIDQFHEYSLYIHPKILQVQMVFASSKDKINFTENKNNLMADEEGLIEVLDDPILLKKDDVWEVADIEYRWAFEKLYEDSETTPMNFEHKSKKFSIEKSTDGHFLYEGENQMEIQRLSNIKEKDIKFRYSGVDYDIKVNEKGDFERNEKLSSVILKIGEKYISQNYLKMKHGDDIISYSIKNIVDIYDFKRYIEVDKLTNEQFLENPSTPQNKEIKLYKQVQVVEYKNEIPEDIQKSINSIDLKYYIVRIYYITFIIIDHNKNYCFYVKKAYELILKNYEPESTGPMDMFTQLKQRKLKQTFDENLWKDSIILEFLYKYYIDNSHLCLYTILNQSTRANNAAFISSYLSKNISGQNEKTFYKIFKDEKKNISIKYSKEKNEFNILKEKKEETIDFTKYAMKVKVRLPAPLVINSLVDDKIMDKNQAETLVTVVNKNIDIEKDTKEKIQKVFESAWSKIKEEKTEESSTEEKTEYKAKEHPIYKSVFTNPVVKSAIIAKKDQEQIILFIRNFFPILQTWSDEQITELLTDETKMYSYTKESEKQDKTTVKNTPIKLPKPKNNVTTKLKELSELLKETKQSTFDKKLKEISTHELIENKKRFIGKIPTDMKEYDTKLLELFMKIVLLTFNKGISEKNLKYLMKIFGENKNYHKYYKHFRFLNNQEIHDSDIYQTLSKIENHWKNIKWETEFLSKDINILRVMNLQTLHPNVLKALNNSYRTNSDVLNLSEEKKHWFGILYVPQVSNVYVSDFIDCLQLILKFTNENELIEKKLNKLMEEYKPQCQLSYLFLNHLLEKNNATMQNVHLHQIFNIDTLKKFVYVVEKPNLAFIKPLINNVKRLGILDLLAMWYISYMARELKTYKKECIDYLKKYIEKKIYANKKIIYDESEAITPQSRFNKLFLQDIAKNDIFFEPSLDDLVNFQSKKNDFEKQKDKFVKTYGKEFTKDNYEEVNNDIQKERNLLKNKINDLLYKFNKDDNIIWNPSIENVEKIKEKYEQYKIKDDNVLKFLNKMEIIQSDQSKSETEKEKEIEKQQKLCLVYSENQKYDKLANYDISFIRELLTVFLQGGAGENDQIIEELQQNRMYKKKEETKNADDTTEYKTGDVNVSIKEVKNKIEKLQEPRKLLNINLDYEEITFDFDFIRCSNLLSITQIFINVLNFIDKDLVNQINEVIIKEDFNDFLSNDIKNYIKNNKITVNTEYINKSISSFQDFSKNVEKLLVSSIKDKELDKIAENVNTVFNVSVSEQDKQIFIDSIGKIDQIE